MRIGYRTVLFFLVFLLPLAAFALYELRFATDRFHSDTSISITQDTNATPSFDLTVIGLPSIADDRDALTLVTFVTSLDMLQYLDSKLQVRQHYSDPNIDWYSRLPPEASLEDFHSYIQNYIAVDYVSTTHLVNVHVQAFSRDFAYKVVNAILERSQKFVDNVNSTVTVEQTKFFENQLKASESRVRDAKNDLLKFQRENGLLTTDAEAAIVNSGIGSLSGLLLVKQGELEIKRRELNENSPIIKGLESEIEILKNQLAQEKVKLSGGVAGSAVSELSAQFREIQFNLEFVENLYKSNLTQLERARLEAIQRLKYLIVITQPSMADASMFPNRGYNIGTAALALLMIYFIVSLIFAIVREHS